MELEQLQQHTMEGDSVYFNALSFYCSRLSCGGAIETCKAVMSGQVKNAIAVIRPPGHHAEPHKAMGFCLFNNVCVATKVIQRDFPECKKVMILDWYVTLCRPFHLSGDKANDASRDVHHGRLLIAAPW